MCGANQWTNNWLSILDRARNIEGLALLLIKHSCDIASKWLNLTGCKEFQLSEINPEPIFFPEFLPNANEVFKKSFNCETFLEKKIYRISVTQRFVTNQTVTTKKKTATTSEISSCSLSLTPSFPPKWPGPDFSFFSGHTAWLVGPEMEPRPSAVEARSPNTETPASQTSLLFFSYRLTTHSWSLKSHFGWLGTFLQVLESNSMKVSVWLL